MESEIAIIMKVIICSLSIRAKKKKKTIVLKKKKEKNFCFDAVLLLTI